MKRRIFIGFVFLTTCLVAGGLYITLSIDQVIDKLETIIALHEVEILRSDLLTDVKAVQQDLLLKDSPHAADLDVVVEHAETMMDAAEGCFDCHHEGRVLDRLNGLHSQIGTYEKALSKVYTTRANAERLNREKQVAFHIGQEIIRDIDSLIETSSQTLGERTEVARDSIAQTRQLVTLLVIVGPGLGLLIAIYFIRDITRSVGTLIEATRRLKGGDLEHTISGLHDEFGELGNSINDMALALRGVIRRIQESEKRYRMLFEGAGDGIFILDAEGKDFGRIVSANRAAAEMHGYSVDELIGLNIVDLDTPDAAVEAPSRIRKMLDGEWINAEINHRKRDGTVFPVEISGGVLEFEDQKYILVFDKDITERKQAEEALQRAEQLVVVGEMAAGLAHEIKNPLAGIKVSIEVLASELQLVQEDREVFQRISDEINRIETLLKDLLSYAKPPTPRVAPVDVNRIIESAIKAAAFSLKGPAEGPGAAVRKKIQFAKELSADLPRTVADSAQLQQVTLNLLLNAIYAIHETGTISVKTSAEPPGAIRIVVSDTGKGIDLPDLDRIFLPFFTTKPKGTGLGLSICKRLIEQQNGTISVARNPTSGLSFTITLPVEQENEGGLS